MGSVDGANGAARGSEGLVLDQPAGTGWWLVDEDESGAERVLAGPFETRAEADWATADAVAGAAHSVHGVRRADGVLARKPSPQEWAWLAHLGEQLDRLPEDWDEFLSETDPMTTLVVEVTAALAEAGLPVHDGLGRTGGASALGGVCLTPAPVCGGVVVAWRQHDRMSVEQVHGPDLDTFVQATMNAALADVLAGFGFAVGPLEGGGGLLVRTAEEQDW